MTLIPAAGFAAFAPKDLPGIYAALEEAAQAYGFKGLVLAHWLGQMHVESAGYTTLTESLNYSVDGLLKTFGRHRISEADARKFGRAPGRPANQSAIANLVYGGVWGRKNLGNTEPGDGWLYRGSGLKQITGRSNTVASGFTPQQLREDLTASAKASAHFFVSHGCVEAAMRDDVRRVTLKVNGGSNGLEDRINQTGRAKRMLGL